MPLLHPGNGVPKTPPLLSPTDPLRYPGRRSPDNGHRITVCPLCESAATPKRVLTVDEYVLRSCPACSFTWSARATDDCHSSADYSDYGEGYLANQMIERIKFGIKLNFFDAGSSVSSNRPAREVKSAYSTSEPGQDFLSPIADQKASRRTALSPRRGCASSRFAFLHWNFSRQLKLSTTPLACSHLTSLHLMT